MGLAMMFVAFYPASLWFVIGFVVLGFLLLRCLFRWCLRHRPTLMRCGVMAMLMLAGTSCSNTSDEPLTVINSSDPTWELQPDHLDYGILPR
jgi:hypothetical protein